MRRGKGRSWFVLTRNRPTRVLSRSLSHVSSSSLFFFFFLSLIFWLFVAAIKQKLFLIRFLLSYLALPFFIQTVPKLIIVKQNLNRTGMESK